MKTLVILLVACSLLVPSAASFADQTTAPGQQKKEAGDGSAKEYAPGQEKAPDSGEKEREKHRVESKEQKQHSVESHGEKAKSGEAGRKAKAGQGK